MAGAVAGALAIGVSELFAGLVAGAPSLVIAVGTLVISLQPPGAKEVFVDLFGTNDKPVLNALVVIAAVAIAAVAGVLAGRRLWLRLGGLRRLRDRRARGGSGPSRSSSRRWPSPTRPSR